MATVPVPGTTGSDLNLIGDNNKNILTGNAGNDYLDGKGGSDALSGGAGNDLLIYDPLDSKIDGGSGFDTLQFGSNQRLNLTGNKVVIQMEEFKLSNGGNNSLLFTAADVIRVSDTDKFRLWGDSTDKITFNDSGWSFNGFTSTGLVQFKNGGAGVEAQIGLWINGFSGNSQINFAADADKLVVEDESATTLTATGSIVVTDPNGQNYLTTQITNAGGHLTQVAQIGSNLGELSLGALTVGGVPIPGISNGSYVFTVANSATQFLAEGEGWSDDFSVMSIDGTPKPLSFTIVGVNDAPVRADSTSQSASVSEIADHAPNENNSTSTRTGSFVITDVDLADSLSYWIESPSGNHGTLTVTSVSAPSATGERTVSWQYIVTDASLDKFRDAAFVETNTIHISDRPEGTAGATVVDVAVQINIQGANDGVELMPLRSGVDVVERTISEASNAIGNVTPQSLGFQFQARDVDLQDTFSVASTGTSLSASPIGTLGSGSTSNYDPATGTRDVQYTFQWQDSQLDFLAQGQTLDKQFQVSFSDLQTTEYQTITLHFVGANDAPVQRPLGVGNATTATVAEIADNGANENAFSHTRTGSFVIRDVDQTDTLSSWISNPVTHRGTLSVMSITSPDANGDRTVNWQYVVADSALDSLRDLQSTENYSINISDRSQGTGGATVLTIPIVITLDGANDAPVRHVVSTDVLTGSVTELAASNANANSSTFMHQATGSFQVQDVDIGDPLTRFSILQSSSNSVLYGNLVVDDISSADTSGIRTVHWTYSVSDHDLDPLPAGSGPTQTFAIRLTDGPAILTQNVTISLIGASDGPSFGGDKVKVVSEFNDGQPDENFGVHMVSGTVTATNMPAGSLLVEQVGFPGDFALGSFSATASAIDANGNATISWTYVVADCLLDVLDGGGLSDNVQLLITHSENSQITQRVSIALAGISDIQNSPEVTYFDALGNAADYSTSGFPLPNTSGFQVYGLDNEDTLRTGANALQTLFGGDGNDVFKLSSGTVFAVGGIGNDRFDFIAGTSTVWAWGQQGGDIFNITNADPNAKLWAMDFTLFEDHIAGAGTSDKYTLTTGTTSATNFAAEGFNPNVVDGTPYYRLTGPNQSNVEIDLYIIGLELSNLNPAPLFA